MANIQTFTAAIKRGGQQVRLVPNCATYEGFLCRLQGRTLQPIWNAVAIESDGIAPSAVSSIPTVQAAIEAGKSQYLLQFGKHEGYWIWNHEAAERKKLESGKTVYLYEKKQDPWDDDESEIRMSDKPYPKEVWAAIAPHIRKDRHVYEIINYSGLVAALSTIGWKTKL